MATRKTKAEVLIEKQFANTPVVNEFNTINPLPKDYQFIVQDTVSKDTLLISDLDEYRINTLKDVFNITSLHDLIETSKNEEMYQELMVRLDISPNQMNLIIRRACLLLSERVDDQFAMPAAKAGIRNLKDLVRTDPEKLHYVFKAMNRGFDESNTRIYTKEEIRKIIDALRAEVLQGIPNYSYVQKDDEEPTDLFDFKYQYKSDNEILEEGLEYLNNIPVALPLPRTISGTVKIKNGNQDDSKAKAAFGYKVEITGVANPQADVMESDEGLVGYTDTNGRFTIMLPDRYNLQETVKITISLNPNITRSMNAHQATTSSNCMTFIRRASEIMNQEYVIVKKDKVYAKTILKNFVDISALNKEILKLENEIQDKATLWYRKEQIEKQVKDAKETLQKSIYDILDEYQYHYQAELNSIEPTLIASRKYKTMLAADIRLKLLLCKKYIENRVKNESDTTTKKVFNEIKSIIGTIYIDLDKSLNDTALDAILKNVDQFHELYDGYGISYLQAIKAKVEALPDSAFTKYPNVTINKKAIDLDTFIDSFEMQDGFNYGDGNVCNGLADLLMEKTTNQGLMIDYLYDITNQMSETGNNLPQYMELRIGIYQAAGFAYSKYEQQKENADEIKIQMEKATSALTLIAKNRDITLGNLPSFNHDSLEEVEKKEDEQLHMFLEQCNLFKERTSNLYNAIDEYDSISQLYQSFDATYVNVELDLFEQFIAANKVAKNATNLNENQALVNSYLDKKDECKKLLQQIMDINGAFENDKNQSIFYHDINALLQAFLSSELDSDLGDLIVIKDIFDGQDRYPRALPNVRLMGEGNDATYLPTDNAPSRTFNYGMIQRLVAPTISKNGVPIERKKIKSAINVMQFKDDFYKNPNNIPIATSLGIGYVLNMHQAWVPDGFALGSLLYSLVLAPGEEQRIIVREKREEYSVSDDASATDLISDTYANSQNDSESAVFNQSANRFSAAHSDYAYSTSTKSSGRSSLGIFFGLSMGSKASSSSRSSSVANSNQQDRYFEASNAAQNFQSDIKSESERLAVAKRTSVRLASSEEKESLSSRLIANHNHSHVMTIQYWEVMKRYKMETSIDSVDLVLFVPLEPINFISGTSGRMKQNYYSNYSLDNLTKSNFIERYGILNRYYDALYYDLPRKYRKGLDTIKRFASYYEWTKANYSNGASNFTINISGGFIPSDHISATLSFAHSNIKVTGRIVSNRIEVMNIDSKQINTKQKLIEEIKDRRLSNKSSITFSFTIPENLSVDDISLVTLKNTNTNYQYRLSQEGYTTAERKAIDNYETKIEHLYQDNHKSDGDIIDIKHYEKGLPESYLNQIVVLSQSEFNEVGGFDIVVTAPTKSNFISNTYFNQYASINMSSSTPILTIEDFTSMESTLQHIVSQSMDYSQSIWASLSDDERILMLEPYTIDMNFASYKGYQNENLRDSTTNIPLLNCINVKKLLGFYGNCMMFPFTYPEELADRLGKTAAQVQDELYRYHTTNFRVPTTTISIPTDGMIGEAVLGATNVSEKVDITRFWNWKDSENDHLNIDQSGFSGNSLLANASTMQIDAPTVGVTPTAHIEGSQSLQSLLSKSSPTWADVLANTDIRDLLANVDKNASTGRDKVIEANTSTINEVIKTAGSLATAALSGGTSAAADGVVGKITGALKTTSDIVKDSQSNDEKDKNSQQQENNKQTDKENDPRIDNKETIPAKQNEDGTFTLSDGSIFKISESIDDSIISDEIIKSIKNKISPIQYFTSKVNTITGEKKEYPNEYIAKLLKDFKLG